MPGFWAAHPSDNARGSVATTADRASQLTANLLAFARKQPLRPLKTDVNALIEEVVKLLAPTLGRQVEIETALSDQAWPALVDRSQLTSALVNLAINARDAMPDGGRLLFRTANFTRDAGDAEVDDLGAGDYVAIEVIDSGAGIPPAIRDRIFEPFYTTKPKGQGTGLGLATVYGIIKQSGGYIWVYSEVGRGSIFKIYLPTTGRLAQPKELTVRSSFAERSIKLTGTVLVVEDDPIVRELIGGFLKDIGLTVLEAGCAEDALLMPFESGSAPRLLVTDNVLPGTDGVSLAIGLLARFPPLKIIVMSGYIEPGLPDPQLLKDARFLTKPFSRNELREQVLSLLQ